MAKKLTIRQVMNECNIGRSTILDFLGNKGVKLAKKTPNSPISEEIYIMLLEEFAEDKTVLEKARKVREEQQKEKEIIQKERAEAAPRRTEEETSRPHINKPKVVGKVELEDLKKPKEEKKAETKQVTHHEEEIKEKEEKTPVSKEKDIEKKKEKGGEETLVEEKIEVQKEEKAVVELKKIKKAQAKDSPVVETTSPKVLEEPKEEKPEEPKELKTKYQKLQGPKLTGEKIDLKSFEKKPKKKEADKTADAKKKKKRKRERVPVSRQGGGRSNDHRSRGRSNYKKPVEKKEVSEEEIKKQIKETLERLQGGRKSKRSKVKKEGRQKRRAQEIANQEKEQLESQTLKVTEFITVADLANMMDVPVADVIKVCFDLGIMATMNQRLDAETLSLVADEFGYDVEFVDVEAETTEEEEQDKPEDLVPRPPVVTIMGHVDHGKTSLLDYIRNANVVAGESGGITQHIGAYKVELPNGEKLTFIDTPGHEAFTAMRARGTKVTDVAVIVIAADDDVMPQTKEAISHAQAAGVPMVFAINKIDRPTANPDNIKQQLANMNILLEDWGGKYQSQEISAKTGQGVDELLEKILLEAELLELKANPNKSANGTVLEAALDKGRGYVADVLVQNGTLKVGDYLLAGKYHGKVKAMYDERDRKVKEAGPSTPVKILGLDGAPAAGDKFKVYEDEREAKKIAQKRDQLIREQQLRTQKHLTLDEIGRRIALGDFKELNLIIKGDVDGSVEALADSLQKLSTENIQVKIIHRGVGQITDSDVMLAAASDAIIIGFNVRPSSSARKLAEHEGVQIKTYSIIYDVINDVKEAMEGMLSPEVKEEVTGTAEVRNTFKISKVGTVAGCMVTSGKIFNNSLVRVIREGIVIYDGELASLKRFKDDVKEVSKGYECGLMVKNYNNIEEGDVIEAYRKYEVKRKL